MQDFAIRIEWQASQKGPPPPAAMQGGYQGPPQGYGGQPQQGYGGGGYGQQASMGYREFFHLFSLKVGTD